MSATEHDLIAEEGLSALERRGVGLAHQNPLGEVFAEALAEVLDREFCEPLVLGPNVKKHGMGVGRERELLSRLELLLSIPIVIVVAGKLDARALWSEGLHHDLAFEVAAARSTRDLGEELETALTSSEVWQVEAEVSV